MKRSLLIFVVLIVIGTAGVQPAAAQNRYIVRTTGGLGSVLNLCSLLGCQVQGSLDGNINQTFLVTSSTNIVVNLLNFTVNLVDSLLGIQSIEPDKLLPVPQTSTPAPCTACGIVTVNMSVAVASETALVTVKIASVPSGALTAASS